MQADRPFVFLECTDNQGRPGNDSLLARPHLPVTTLLSLNRGVGGKGPDAVFLLDNRGNHVPIMWRSGRGPTGLTVSLLWYPSGTWV